MQIISSLLELVGLALLGAGLFFIGGVWLLAVVAGVILTLAGYAIGRPARPETP